MRTPVDAGRLRAFMRALARTARAPAQVYFVGGATAVAEGWRQSTIDIDLALDAGAILRAIPSIKEALDINVELASPADFIPVRPGWQDRSPFVAQEGQVTFRHFDLYARQPLDPAGDLCEHRLRHGHVGRRGLPRAVPRLPRSPS